MLSLLSGEQRTSHFKRVMSVHDSGCVKTPTSNLRVESLSRLRRITKEPLWQSRSKEEKRENNSAHSLLVRVFTHPGPKGDIGVRKSVRQRRERPKVPLRRLAKCVTVRGGQGQPEPRHTLEFR